MQTAGTDRDRRRAGLALEIIGQAEAAVRAGRPADQVLRQIFKAHSGYGSRDRRFYADTMFSWFRWRGWTGLAQEVPPAGRAAAACLLDAEEMAPELCGLADEAGWEKDRLAAAAALSLADKARRIAGWFGLSTPPPVAALVPAWIEDALAHPGDDEPGIHFTRCVEAFQSRPPTWLRVSRSAKDRIVEWLDQRHAQPERHDRLPCAVAAGRPFALAELQKATASHPQIQDLSSQCVGLVCDPAPGERWWDLCTGGGGKALHLATLMDNRGAILATDPRAESLREVQRRAQAIRTPIIRTRRAEGTTSPDEEPFDGVLVDAPCSGIGTWARNPDARWRTTDAFVQDRAALQARLLAQAAEAVRPGGRLVYSVCTLTRAETFETIDAFLSSRPDFAADPFPHPLTGEMTAGLAWIWPWQGPCNGMFVARLGRN